MTVNNRLSRLEIRAALSLALLFFLRMLGLFMLLPVLALYVTELAGATPTRIGLAIGIYALTQAAFQIPMGMLSDKFGRKPIIALGLLIFCGGSVLAALTNNVLFVIFGRALQGCGAISSAALALASDLTADSQRTKIMAIIGVSIGLAFSVAFVIGPVLDGLVGLSGLFWASATLGILGIAVLLFMVPAEPAKNRPSVPLTAEQSSNAKIQILFNRTVVGGFFLHAVLAASFVAIPLILLNQLGLGSEAHYRIYLPVILISLVLVAPLVMLSNRNNRQQAFILATTVALAIGLALIALASANHALIYVGMTVFFLGFNYLEAALPSQASKEAASHRRGQVMGSYATLQFLGTFFGAFIGGLVLEHAGVTAVISMAGLLSIAWFSIQLASAKAPAPAE